MGASPATPTNIRFLIVAVTSLTAVFMYVDRACISQLKTRIGEDLAISDQGMDWIMSAFFWSYAMAQVPAGFAGKWFGLRKSLAIMLFTWSVCTAACGLATGFAGLFVARLAVGISEAGAYPSAAAIVKGWFPLSARGRANSFVAFGGRGGFALSQMLTPLLAVTFLGWRGVLILYGVLGMIWAFVFWFVIRDRAAEHPWANQAEADHAASPTGLTGGPEYDDDDDDDWKKSPALDQNARTPVKATGDGQPANTSLPIVTLLASWNMWCFGFAQFGSNMGWAFLITNLPGMLEKYFGCDDPAERGLISAIPIACSCFGMLLGGFVGDWCVRRYGLKWGRRLPISVMMFMAGLAYLSCILITEPRFAAGRAMIPIGDAWLVAIALACMAISVDIGIPSIWAFAQDVGGKHVGATLGFGNMIGNLGAAASPLLLGSVQREYGYNNVFVVCAGCFILASVFTLMTDATRQVLDD